MPPACEPLTRPKPSSPQRQAGQNEHPIRMIGLRHPNHPKPLQHHAHLHRKRHPLRRQLRAKKPFMLPPPIVQTPVPFPLHRGKPRIHVTKPSFFNLQNLDHAARDPAAIHHHTPFPHFRQNLQPRPIPTRQAGCPPLHPRQHQPAQLILHRRIVPKAGHRWARPGPERLPATRFPKRRDLVHHD